MSSLEIYLAQRTDVPNRESILFAHRQDLAEARAEALRRVEAAVRGLPTTPTYDYEDESADMCPNCVTPWKCNGPHDPPERTPDGFLIDLAAVLAVIRDTPPEET